MQLQLPLSKHQRTSIFTNRTSMKFTASRPFQGNTVRCDLSEAGKMWDVVF